MANKFKVIIPEMTQNFLKNSSFERWSSSLPLDWNATTPSGVVSESVTNMRFGASAMRVVATTPSGVGMYQNVSALTSGSLATASVYAYVAAGTARLRILDSTGVTTYATGDIATLGWNRIEVPLTLPATGVRIALLAVGTSADVTFDGVQLEQKAYATTYADGSVKGSSFQGEYHRSSSIRSAYGGRVKDIETDIVAGVAVETSNGFGAGTPQINADSYGALDGGYVSSVSYPAKDMAITMKVLGTDIDTLHAKRKELITALSPVRIPTQQPLVIRFTENSVEKDIEVIPNGGFEAPNIGRNIYEKVTARFISYNPFFRSPYDSAKQLGYSTAITATSILIRDNNDLWYTLPLSTNGSVNAVVYNPLDPDELIVAGSFTTFNGVSANSIARYRLSTGTVTAMGTGLGTIVNTVAVDVNGDIYAGGTFTVDGSANSRLRIAKFAFGGSTWSAVGTGAGGGVNGNVYGLKFDNNRNLFIYGAFTAATSGTALTGIGKLVSGASAITAAVTGLTATAVWDLAFTPDNTMYVGGDFTFTGGGKGIAKVVDGTTTPVLMAGSLNSIVRSLWYDKRSNLLYVGGQFTTEQNTSLVLRGIASWNGVAFTEIGNGVDSSVVYVAVDSKGNLIIYGTFTKVNGATAATQRILKWNGNYWTQLDMELLSFTDITSLGITPNGYLSMGTFNTATTLKSNTHTTVTNDGNAPSTAQFRFNGPGKLQSIKNETTGQFVDLNYTMVSGEIVYLDFSASKVTAVSSFYGNILNKVFATGYNVQPFYLVPGSNDISVFINGTTTVGTTDARIIWRSTYYSGD